MRIFRVDDSLKDLNSKQRVHCDGFYHRSVSLKRVSCSMPSRTVSAGVT